ncbi:MAG: MerR family transcriptional regulator [Chloroflexi bacterium]|nr:MAG: MerR family transcriptional regulator [Chloroflexota bacterium]TMD53913.1 MAG: MerR family transcriptional regulator [Chloroflexota bacterium]
MPHQEPNDAREPVSRGRRLVEGVGHVAVNRRADIRSGFDLDKPLYTISVASEILETHPRTLMLYEDVGLIEPFRTPTNRRRYSQRDIRKLRVIQTLTREKGVNLAGVKHLLTLLEVVKKNDLEPPKELRDIYKAYAELI